MNYIFSGGAKQPWRDARPLFFVGRHDDDVVIAARRIIKGFIDHDISIVGAVDSNGHFNAVIGYRGQVSPVSEPFYAYTADPLNGWGRPDNRQPRTWRRISISRDTLLDDSGENYEGLFGGLIIWNHHAAGGAAVEFVRGDWATAVDAANGNEWLTGNARKPHPIDPLDDSLSLSAQRTP